MARLTVRQPQQLDEVISETDFPTRDECAETRISAAQAVTVVGGRERSGLWDKMSRSEVNRGTRYINRWKAVWITYFILKKQKNLDLERDLFFILMIGLSRKQFVY